MKTKLILCVLALVSAPITPQLSRAEEPTSPPAAVRPEKPYAALTGVIKEKKEKEILVQRDDGQGDVKVTLSDQVRITKDDLPVTATDLVAGVPVELKVKTKDNRIEVVAIKILPPKTKPLRE